MFPKKGDDASFVTASDEGTKKEETYEGASVSWLLEEATRSAPRPAEVALEHSTAAASQLLAQAMHGSAQPIDGARTIASSQAGLASLLQMTGRPPATSYNHLQQAPSSLDASLLQQLGLAQRLPPVAGLPRPPPPPSALQSQLVQLGLLLPGLQGSVPQAPPASTVPALRPSSLEQLIAAQMANPGSYAAPSAQPTSAPTMEQQLSSLARQNHATVPIAQQAAQILGSNNDAILKDGLVSLLLAQQGAAATANPSAPPSQAAASNGQVELLLRALSTANHQAMAAQGQGAVPYASLLPEPRPPIATTNRMAGGSLSLIDFLARSAEAFAASQPAAKRKGKSVPGQTKEQRWRMRYDELKTFKQKHGHCRVPHGYAPNRKLSWWVMNQRAQYQQLQQGKKSWLSEDRVQLLEDLEFDFSPIMNKAVGKSCS